MLPLYGLLATRVAIGWLVQLCNSPYGLCFVGVQYAVLRSMEHSRPLVFTKASLIVLHSRLLTLICAIAHPRTQPVASEFEEDPTVVTDGIRNPKQTDTAASMTADRERCGALCRRSTAGQQLWSHGTETLPHAGQTSVPRT